MLHNEMAMIRYKYTPSTSGFTLKTWQCFVYRMSCTVQHENPDYFVLFDVMSMGQPKALYFIHIEINFEIAV